MKRKIKGNPAVLPFLLFFFLAFAWGSSYFWLKIALRELTPLYVVSFRVLFASLSLGIFMAVRKIRLPKDKKRFAQLSVLSMLSILTPFLLLSWGISKISSSLTGILNGTVPLFTVIIAHFILNSEKINPLKVCGLLMGFSGSLFLVRTSQNTSSLPIEFSDSAILGALAVLAASSCYAASAIYAKKYLIGLNPTMKASVVTWIACAVLWFYLISNNVFYGIPVPSPKLPLTWIALIWLGVIGSCVAYIIYFHLLAVWDATRVSFVMYLSPLVAICLGVVFLKEQANFNLFIGAALIFSGVYLTNRGSKKRSKKIEAVS